MKDTVWSSVPLRKSQIQYLHDTLLENPNIGSESIYRLWDYYPFPSKKSLLNTLEILVDINILLYSNKKFSLIKSGGHNPLSDRITDRLVEKVKTLKIEKLTDLTQIVYHPNNSIYEINKSYINHSYKTLFTLFEYFDKNIESQTNNKLVIPKSSKLGLLLPEHPQKIVKNKTLTKLMIELERKEELGILGEQFALDYELTRLGQTSKVPRIISQINTSAGYDIESYNSKDSIEVDRFIEVKAITAANRFYLSSNEVTKMKLLKDASYLYLVYIDYRDNLEEIKTYKNPYQHIFGSKRKWQLMVNSFEIVL